MLAHTSEQTLALHGGPKAVPQIEGEVQPKIGVEEFMSIAERFGFSPAALANIRAITDQDLGPDPIWQNMPPHIRKKPRAPRLKNWRESFLA